MLVASSQGNMFAPVAERKLAPAVDAKGCEYGWYCTSGKDFWHDKADAEKCCHPDWKRCITVVPRGQRAIVLASGLDAVYYRYWLYVGDDDERT